jgi:quercetin dioxygenase-like cupin family protein
VAGEREEDGGGKPVTFDAFGSLRPYRIWDGAVARAVHGERVTMAIIDLEPGADVPEHAHENEQLGFVLEGTLTMIIGSEARELGRGEAYTIPGSTPHRAIAGPQGATVVDVFSPVRADWEGLERLEPRPGAWPT